MSTPEHQQRAANAAHARATALRLAARPNGASTREVQEEAGCSSDSAERAIQKAKAKGDLWPGKLGHRSVRYFATAKAASAYLQRNAGLITAPKADRPLTPGGGPARLPGEPRITSATKITIAPAPPRVWRTNTFAVAG